jgi:hypothetical protein
VLAGLIVVAVVAGVVVALRPAAAVERTEVGRRRVAPEAALAVVVGLIYVNQVLFTVYLAREHGGDPGFIGRYVPEGWFDLAEGPLIEALARNWPSPALLAPSVMRVNALLELPFVMLAYLTVCRWSWPWVYERALRMVPLMSVVCTATFVLVEWRLRNPYTVEDTVLRVTAAVLVLLGARYLSPTAEGSVGLAFVLSAAGLGLAGLVVYDSALLYNLGHVDNQLPLAVVAAALISTGRWIAGRDRTSAATPAGRAIGMSLGWLLVVAMVPAMPVRYGLNFGAPRLAVASAAVLAAVALGLGIRDADVSIGQLVVPGLAGLVAATVGLLVDVGYTETRLLVAAVAGLVVAIGVAAVSGRARAPDRPAPERRGIGARG